MQKVPTWYGPGFFPDQRVSLQPSKYVVGTDVGIFPFPMIDPNQKNVEGSADTMMMLVRIRPEVRAVMEFFAAPGGLQNWIAAGSAISTNVTTPPEWYAGAYKLEGRCGYREQRRKDRFLTRPTSCPPRWAAACSGPR